MKYRNEIDGLRAIAVVPVILYHAGFELLSGGFIGVDIFFVISGYLITTILIEDMENNRFSIINFYERRARRILPALYLMLLFVSIASSVIMLPSQLEEFGQSLVATVLFSSNIFFFLKTDYWAEQSEFLPLLHTWSLGIEEQYYVLFPILLFFIWRFGKNVVFWLIIIFALISFMLSEIGWRNQPIANFFLIQTRSWELFAGSIVAFIINKYGVKKNNILSILGLSLIIFSIFSYDETTPFPSIYTLIPVIGVMLLIMYGEKNTLIAKLLSAKVFVFFGLISYSAYLWHQPILALTRVYFFDPDLSFIFKYTSIILTIVVSFISYIFIEKPFRDSKIISKKKLIYFTTLPLIIFLAFGFFLNFSHGINDLKMSFKSPKIKYSLNQLKIDSTDRYKLWDQILSNQPKFFEENNKINLLFIGDSISQDLLFASAHSEKILNIFNIGQFQFYNSCAKHIPTGKNKMNLNNECSKSLLELSKSKIVKDSDVILIATQWLKNAKYLQNLLNSKELHNKKIIIYETHAFSDIVSLIMASESMNKSFFDNNFQKFLYLSKNERTIKANQKLNLIAKKNNISTLNGFDVFCNEVKKTCNLFNDNGKPYIIDASHLSIEGIERTKIWLYVEIMDIINSTNFFENKLYLEKNRLEKNK